jgi:hypothetical protein
MGRSRLFHTIVVAGAAITADGVVTISISALPAASCNNDGLKTGQVDMELSGWPDIFNLPSPDIRGWPDIGVPPDLGTADLADAGGWPDIGVPPFDIGGWPDIGMPDLDHADLSVQDVGSWPDIGIPPDMAK